MRYGRVNKYMDDFDVKENMLFFLCGNSEMVSEIYDKLIEKKVFQENIFTEIFF